MDALGVRYNGIDQRLAPVKSDLSPRNITLPAPADYNFLYRVLNLYPSGDADVQQECEAFLRMLPIDRIRMCALYSGLYSSFVTTVLYGVNINTQIIQGWCTGVPIPALANPVFLSGLNMPTATSVKHDALVITQAKRGFRLLTGAGVPGDLYRQERRIGLAASAPLPMQIWPMHP